MRLVLVLVAATFPMHAQPSEALLDDLEDAARHSTFGLEAESRVAEVTRAGFPAIALRFALLAVTRNAGGMAYYKAMRVLAELDIQVAVPRAAESNDPLLAYRALTESVLDDRRLFLDLLKAAHGRGAYGLPSVHAAIRKWHGDEIFLEDMAATLVNGLPEDLGPEEAIYLFDALGEIGPASIDRALLRRAITTVAKAVVQPGFDLPEYRRPTVFRIHGQKIQTQTLSEAALLRALAFGAAVDEREFLTPVLKRLTWAPALKGMKFDELSEALRPVAGPVEAPGVPVTSPKVAQILAQARSGNLTETWTLLESLDDETRIDAIAKLYTDSLGWPKSVSQEDVARKYVSEIERLGSIDSGVVHRLRDSGELVRRLDEIAVRLGRDPAKWPDRLKSRSLLLRRFVYRVEQAASVR